MNLTTNTCKVFLLVYLLIGFTTCKTIKLEQSIGIVKVDNPMGQIKAGIGRADITVPPGHSMGGYGKDLAKISHGWWTRLYTTANYFEDTSGRILVIVASDLWSMSSVLCDLVIQELHREPENKYHLARETILFTATHTHHSQGNFSSTWVYNSESSAESGFDSALVEFLSKQIAQAIIKAIDNKEDAQISYKRSSIKGLTRNRSLKAFLNNPDKDLVINKIGVLDSNIIHRPPHCLTQNDTVFLAIDPTLTTIKINSIQSGKNIGLLSFFGGHPTTLGARSPLLSADVFGVSRHLLEGYLDGTLVSFINGAVGDVSYNWKEQNSQTTTELGKTLAQEVIYQLQDSFSQTITESFQTILAFKKLKNREVETDAWNEFDSYDLNPIKTDKKATIGLATLEGAEDGRIHGLTLEEECNYDESRAGLFQNAQGQKRVYFISNFAIKGDPELLPLGIFSLGDLHLVSIPGEPSVGLCRRIEQAVINQKGGSVISVSMANEYLSYFTTPSEYALQHYEGSSTLYGIATGALLEQEYKSLAALSSFQMQYYKHDPSFGVGSEINKKKLMEKLSKSSDTIGQVLDSVFAVQKSINVNSGVELTSNNNYDQLPTVSIETLTRDGWRTLQIEEELGPGNVSNVRQIDETSSNFLIYSKKESEAIKWFAKWMIPNSYESNLQHRIVFRFPDTTVIKTIDTL